MMQTDRYRIDADARTGFVKITILGFWSVADVARFAEDHSREVRRVAANGRPLRTLIDYSGSSIQSQDVVAAFQHLALNPAVRSLGVALYTTGNFARLQARRIAAVREDMGAFGDLAAAMQWLESLRPLDQGEAA